MFENLELVLSQILQKLDYQEELLQLTISALTTKKAVAKFLNKTDKTIDNYIKNGTFINEVHYYRNENDRIEFIPFAILRFKRTPKIKITPKVDNSKKIYHTAVSDIVKGLKVV